VWTTLRKKRYRTARPGDLGHTRHDARPGLHGRRTASEPLEATTVSDTANTPPESDLFRATLGGTARRGPSRAVWHHCSSSSAS